MWTAKPNTALVFVPMLSLTLGVAAQQRISETKPEPQTKPEAQTQTEKKSEKPPAIAPRTYILGPDDEFTIQALDAEEIVGKSVRIDTGGNIHLPLIGRMRAADLTRDTA
jgi:protein involved in polysaccharide export with SLBB domain